MRTAPAFTVSLSFIALLSNVNAQNPDFTLNNGTVVKLPACGVTCLENELAISTAEFGCAQDDSACACRNVNFSYGIRDCVNESCPSRSDAQATISDVADICRQYGASTASAISSGTTGSNTAGPGAVGAGSATSQHSTMATSSKGTSSKGTSSKATSSKANSSKATSAHTATAQSIASSSTSSAASQGTGLSTGAKAGIGVGVALGVLILAGLGVLIFLLVRMKRDRERSTDRARMEDWHGAQHLDGVPRSELAGKEIPAEVPGSEPKVKAQQREAVEMPSDREV